MNVHLSDPGDETLPPKRDVWQAIRRGMRKKCPACGKGRLLAGYLKQAPTCSNCGEATGAIRADDGPPWLTILVVGHIISPGFLLFSHTYEPAPWLPLAIVMGTALGLTAWLLPVAKGFFIGMLWATQAGDMTSDPA